MGLVLMVVVHVANIQDRDGARLLLAKAKGALLERQVRRNLKGKPLYGLYPENRPSPAPTGPAILQCFAKWSVVIIKERGRTMRRLGEPSATQRRLLILLGIPPDHQRAFKRRCK